MSTTSFNFPPVVSWRTACNLSHISFPRIKAPTNLNSRGCASRLHLITVSSTNRTRPRHPLSVTRGTWRGINQSCTCFQLWQLSGHMLTEVVHRRLCHSLRYILYKRLASLLDILTCSVTFRRLGLWIQHDQYLRHQR